MGAGWALSLALVAAGQAGAFEWQTADPAGLGFDPQRLDALWEHLAEHRTEALLVVRGDRIVFERYQPPMTRTKPHYTASLAKAIVGGLSLGLTMDDRRIAPDDLASRYVPAWAGDPRKARITIRQLATHTAGLDDANQEGVPHNRLPGWMGAFWRRDPDPFSISRDQTPVVFEPGSAMLYSNPGMAMLSWCITAARRGDALPDVRSLLARRIVEPLGIPPNQWSIGYGKTYAIDGLPLVANWGGGNVSPDAAARIGRLLLRRGDWEGQPLLRPETVDQLLGDAGVGVTRGADPRPRSGLGWWVNSDGFFPDLPRDAASGAGAGGQLLLVVPSLDLVVVRFGGDFEPNRFWGGAQDHLFAPLAAAFAEPPFPRSRVLPRAEFAPAETIQFAAIDSDNWPLTWAADDDQYTSYGDGWGFEPRTAEKLSLGWAKVSGPPERFVGVNLRSPTGERPGDGARGPKASGLVMVDGVLYAWIRNTGNAQLCWSKDHAVTWEWGFKLDTSFGCPAFLNVGRNHAGAPDPYVYTYSSDGPSAYEAYDQVVLARARRDQLTDRAAYEFLAGFQGDGSPIWSADLAQRQPTLRYAGHCRRLDAVYHPALGRYLLLLGFDDRGGWGIFEAPAPWGPWSLVWHTFDWGLGACHGYRLPRKWMSEDGRTAWVVFSGRIHEGRSYDAFCVRQVRFPAP